MLVLSNGKDWFMVSEVIFDLTADAYRFMVICPNLVN